MLTGQRNTPISHSRLAEQVLSLFGSNESNEKLITDILLLIQIETGIESVGIRLKEGLDFPYYFTRGFSADFVEKEMYLCSRDPAGEIIRDSEGNPTLECMCGNVICGRTDASLPFFTKNGSFWTNSTTALLASTTEKERKGRTRNRCNGVGYESVALIPVRTGNTIHGLVQLNDKRKGLYSEEFVTFMEGVAANIGLLFLMVEQQKILSNRAEDVKNLISVRTRILERIATMLKKNSFEKTSHSQHATALEALNNVLQEIDTLKGILPICLRCKGIRNDAGYWEKVEQYICDRTKAQFSHTYCPDCYKTTLQELGEKND